MYRLHDLYRSNDLFKLHDYYRTDDLYRSHDSRDHTNEYITLKITSTKRTHNQNGYIIGHIKRTQDSHDFKCVTCVYHSVD